MVYTPYYNRKVDTWRTSGLRKKILKMEIANQKLWYSTHYPASVHIAHSDDNAIIGFVIGLMCRRRAATTSLPHISAFAKASQWDNQYIIWIPLLIVTVCNMDAYIVLCLKVLRIIVSPIPSRITSFLHKLHHIYRAIHTYNRSTVD